MTKSQGTCVFCGGFGLTKEHVIPKWIRPLLSDGPASHTRLTQTFAANPLKSKIPALGPEISRQGYLFNTKLRMVCKDCNEGWLNTCEQEIKPTLSKLIVGEHVFLDKAAQAKISRWAGLRTAIWEKKDPASGSLRKGDYDALKNCEQLNSTWRVYAAPYRGHGSLLRLNHLSAAVTKYHGEPIAVYNTQMTLIGLEKLLLYTVSTWAENPETLLAKLAPTGMIRIWPYQFPVQWKDANELSVQQIVAILEKAPAHI